MSEITSQPIIYDDFAKVELRVGLVTEVKIPEWSEKLLELTVDLGPELGMRTIFAGIKKWYEPAELVNKKFIFVANLAPRKMGPAVSQGMMLMVDAADKPLKIELPEDALPGAKLR